MCFGRAFHLILMHFYILYSMLWDKLSKNQVFFSKKLFFPEFRLIQFHFRSIKILFKKFSEPLPGLINRTCFSINWTSCFRFFKTVLWLIQTPFQKFFQTFLSLSDLARQHKDFFVIFYLNFCKVFLPQGR